MRIQSLLAVAAATAFLACSGSDGGPTDPGPPDDRTFSPTTDTELSGAVEFDEVSIPEGVTVNVTGDLTLTVAGPIAIAGDLAGDCVGIDLVGSAEVTINGRIANVCGTPVDGAPGITITGDGEMVFDGASIESSGGISSRNDPALSLELQAGARSLRPAQDGGSNMVFAGSRFKAGNGSPPDDVLGEDVTVTPTDQFSSAYIIKTSSGLMHLRGNNEFLPGNGARGGDATAESSTEARAQASVGEIGGTILLSAPKLRFSREAGGTNRFETGDGGRGGNAVARGLENAGTETAAGAIARAGDGGGFGAFVLSHPNLGGGLEVAVEPGAIEVLLGDGGRGGHAFAVGADGVDATAQRAAQAGGEAVAQAGEGNTDTMVFNSMVLAPSVPRDAYTGGRAGRGGDAVAVGGDGGGGDGVVGRFPDGADGGEVTALGGAGGDVSFSGPSGTSSLAPSQDPEVMTPGDGGDANLAEGGGGAGADRCGDSETFDAEGKIAVKDDLAGSNEFLFRATRDGINIVLHVVFLTTAGPGGNGGKGGDVGKILSATGSLPDRLSNAGVGGHSEFSNEDGQAGRTFVDKVSNGGDAGRGDSPGVAGAPGGRPDGAAGINAVTTEPSFQPGAAGAACGENSRAPGSLVPAQEGERQITIAGDAPWIEVTDTLVEDGTVTAEGTGTMVGVPGVKVTFEGTLADGRLQGDYAMDTEKKIDPDHPIVYAVDIQRQ